MWLAERIRSTGTATAVAISLSKTFMHYQAILFLLLSARNERTIIKSKIQPPFSARSGSELKLKTE
jgi:hypothetical protein